MKTFIEAIATEEGFYVHDSRPQRNHNPGDLIFGDEARRFGAVKGDPHFAIFIDDEMGWSALRRWLGVPAHFVEGNLTSGYLGATVKQIIHRFAPPSENDSDAYVKNVCLWTGLTPETVITHENLG